ncbi:fibulin-2-like [Branchiostoma floridae]|uniref:Fibulin-2-like n=1 Tax=Branchiostoma floridae TaxID=7739 RepID=A0A9J7KPW3_BRAFL|nr:fibulin-2-like [Branchiostoma floridae]
MTRRRTAMLFLVVVHLVISLGGGEEVYSSPGGDEKADLMCTDDIGNKFKEGDTVWLDFGSRKCLCAKGKLTSCSDAYECPPIPEDCVETRDIPDYCTICSKRGCKSPTKGKYLNIGETHIQEKACIRCECKEGSTLQCSDIPGCARDRHAE